MTNKKYVKLTETDIHNIVKESVNKILNEYKKTLLIKKRVKIDPKSQDTLNLPSDCADQTIYRWRRDENGDLYLKVHCENGDRAYVGDFVCLGYDKKWYIQKRK